MKLSRLCLKNFQSFGPQPTTVDLDQLTFILGPNGSGKTAVLTALTRLFSPVPAMRRVQLSDFHEPADGGVVDDGNELWVEVDIEFEEAADEEEDHPSIPAFFKHMALACRDGDPCIRIRLTASIDADEYIDEKIEYITEVDSAGEPLQRSEMSRHDRGMIEVHYLPARRDPLDHISFTANSLLGRMFRAADWTKERGDMVKLSEELTSSMASNAAVMSIGSAVQGVWDRLHKGRFFTDPSVTFGHGDMQDVLRQLTLTFAPGPGGAAVDSSRLSDGQKSLLYISLVMAWRQVSRKVLNESETAFDADKLRPPVYMILALEEPENSLAPQNVGRIIQQLREACSEGDVQGLVTTHAPSLLHRVEPEDIRFLRLDENRTTQVRTVVMPEKQDEAAKYVREAVRAYPELYFARLVILGEGDSEQIVLPRVLAAAGIAEDDISVSVVPLGGRHVHHFWRLLERLQIPYVTLLDLDSGRYQGGWGRIRYAINQLNKHTTNKVPKEILDRLPRWDEDVPFPDYGQSTAWIESCERNGVFFSNPLDLDLMMLEAYPDAYGACSTSEPSASTMKAVLGKNPTNTHRYSVRQLQLFEDYHNQFKLGSKPANHVAAMATFDADGSDMMWGLPKPLVQLLDAVRKRLESLPE